MAFSASRFLSQELAVWNGSHCQWFTLKLFLPLYYFLPTQSAVEEIEANIAGQCCKLNFSRGNCR